MTNQSNMAGLTSAEARALQQRYGRNELVPQKKQSFLKKALNVLCEPMFILLIVAAMIYFVLGEPRDGAVMLIFVVGMIGIDIAQEWKTDKTLAALKDLSAPRARVIRDGIETTIASSDLVPGDLMLICEGEKVPADGAIVFCNDLCVDESSLTGESAGVWKQVCDEDNDADFGRRDYCYAGTSVVQGSGCVRVTKIGADTEYGKIGAHIAAAEDAPTPLQNQTRTLVRLCAAVAAVLCLLAGAATYINLPTLALRDRIIKSILAGVTLSMAMIPEEFPVILTVFLSMGAWRLAKKHSLVRRLPSVETLGAVSVLCVDKTGTITVNHMSVEKTWAPAGDDDALITAMGMACETDAYDPMEKAMLAHCEARGLSKDRMFGGSLIAEYPFTNELKMMGHVWQRGDGITIAAKGSPERLLPLCHLSDAEHSECRRVIDRMTADGLRVIAVASAHPACADDVPGEITDCTLTFLGLIALADPPRESVARDIALCRRAGIRVVMITGDNGGTASAIARRIGMANADQIITGDMLSAMDDAALREAVRDVNIFARVIPEHKMRIVKALKDNGAIVAMTGDGVNDAPALKYADIGVAMGGRGSEVSREAADLILMDDNFTTIVETVHDGRRIYDNIRRAVGYVFSIHIPIALASLLAPMLGVAPDALFLLPLHVVLLELVIDPTCSIVLERQPEERDIMDRAPRDPEEPLMTKPALIKCVLQGLAVFAAAFGVYYANLADPAVARAMGLTVIILSNLLLVFVNCSHSDLMYRSVCRLLKDRVMWIVLLLTIGGLGAILYSPLNTLLKLAPLSPARLLTSVGLSMAAVLWYEIVKLMRGK